MKCVIAAAALGGLTGQGDAAPAAPSGACPVEGADPVVVQSVGEGLDIVLADGRVLNLPGVEPPRATPGDPDRPDRLRRQLEAALAGRVVSIVPTGPPDRWGRVPAIVFAALSPGLWRAADENSEEINLANALIGAGAARYRPDAAAHACRAALLAAEHAAREGRKGVWADPRLQPIVAGAQTVSAENIAALADGLAVVEGSVVSVGETPSRVYLNLGRARGGFAISVSKRNKDAMESEDFSLARHIGSRVRVRGLADARFGSQIDLVTPDALEILAIGTPRPDSKAASE